MTIPVAVRRHPFFAPLREGVEPSARWVEYAGRTGYLAKGVVYGIVGLLAVQAAFTAAKTPDSGDALAAIRAAPFGRLLLGLTAAGLLCYAAWRLIEAVWDTEHAGRDWKGVGKRIGFAVAGLANLLIAFAAGTAALGGGSPAGGSNRQNTAATVLAWPGGWTVLVAAGLVLLGVGLFHFRKAYRADFMADYERVEMTAKQREWVRPIGRFGLAARGVTFCIIGLFLALAGWRANAGQVKGLGDAFTVVARQPFGQVLLAIVAAGFVAYGVYCLSRARYRRFAA